MGLYGEIMLFIGLLFMGYVIGGMIILAFDRLVFQPIADSCFGKSGDPKESLNKKTEYS